MKGFLYSQDGSYAFPLGPKVTTIGRENCDISINSPHIDGQHALMEYDDDKRCFILKDLNSSTGTFIHDCRVQNAAVQLSNGDIVRFGCNGLPLEFRIEQQESSMPPIFPRQAGSNSLQLISQTIPSRRAASGTTAQPQQIDLRPNLGFSMKGRPVSAGTKQTIAQPPSGGARSSVVRCNAWTISNTPNPPRSVINGSFSGELDLPPSSENTDIGIRVDQLEREVKGRDTEIRELNDRLKTIEPLSSTFTTEVHALRSELEKLKREKNAASGLISSLQRDLHSKESDLAKLTREIEGIKTDSRDKDLRLQSLQAKLNLLRDRGRVEEDRYTKEKELVNLRNKIKFAEQQVTELNESVNRLKSQLQDTEKQLLRLNQNEQKFKQECEQARGQLAESQRQEAALKGELSKTQGKHQELCNRLWKCLSSPADDDDDEYDEDEHNLLELVQQLQQQLKDARSDLERQRDGQQSSNGQLRTSLSSIIDLLMNVMQEQTTDEGFTRVRQQLTEIDESTDGEQLVAMAKKAAINAIDQHTRLIAGVKGLLIQPEVLPIGETLALIRRQYEQLEAEKNQLTAESLTRERQLRTEFEQSTAEKDAEWQQRFNEECDRLRQEMSKLQKDSEEQLRLLSERLQNISGENNDYLQKWTELQNTSAAEIDDLTGKLDKCQRQLAEQENEEKRLRASNEKQSEEANRVEREKTALIEDLSGQVEVYKDQVRQFSKTIVQLEKNLKDEQEKLIKLQLEKDKPGKPSRTTVTPPSVPTPPPAPVLAETFIPMIPIVDHSQEFFAYKSRVQEQEQIIISLRRDLAGMTARLSDVHGELNEKQKRALEKSEFTIREQTKELNDTRTKLSKLSEIVEKQSAQVQTLQSDLSKSKVLANQYQLLVDQRQSEIDRLSQTLEQKNLIVERVEKSSQDEGRVTHELVAIGAQCKGERHEQTIARQREALNELRARIKSLEQSRPINPSYEKVLQQVVLLKRELAEIRARQALPSDLPFVTSASGTNSFYQPSSASFAHSPTMTNMSDLTPEAQKIFEERAAHVETMTALQSCDELLTSSSRKLIQLLGIDDDSLVSVAPLSTMAMPDRYVGLQQRQRTMDILVQKIEMLYERLTRKEELLRDYEKDLGRLRQAEILLREKDTLIHDLETDKRSKDDESHFLRNTLRETEDHLNQEKRTNSSLKFGRSNGDASQSNELIRRSGAGGSTTTLHHHCPPDSTSKVRTVKRDMSEKISRKDYEIKTLKQELHEALDTLSEQSHKVKLLESQSKDTPNGKHYAS